MTKFTTQLKEVGHLQILCGAMTTKYALLLPREDVKESTLLSLELTLRCSALRQEEKVWCSKGVIEWFWSPSLLDRKEDYAGWIREYLSPVYHLGRDMAGVDLNLQPIHSSVQYCGGGEGYYLSRKALSVISRQSLSYLQPVDTAMYEDVYFAELLASESIYPVHRATPKEGGYLQDCFEIFKLLRWIYAICFNCDNG